MVDLEGARACQSAQRRASRIAVVPPAG
jgi:hypothetical protein